MNQIFQNKKIAYIQASWHKDIVEQAYLSFQQELGKTGISDQQIDLFDVPGSLEIPLQAKLLSKTNSYDIIVACGFIVNGGIYRHDFVASTVIDAMMKIQLETEIPILSVVLTPHHYHEHETHNQFFIDHFKIKGAEAAQACLETLKNIDGIKNIRESVL